MEVLITLSIGAAGGIIALVAEHIYLYFRDKRIRNRQRLITFPNTERIIDQTIFERLSPGHSIELMKAALGTPDKTYQDSEPIFQEYREEEEGLMVYEFESEEDKEKYEANKFKTTVYFYTLKNAQVKITSKNRETIDSLAVEVKEAILDVSDFPFGWVTSAEKDSGDLILGETKVTKELVESSRLEYLFSRFENIIILSVYTAAPLYTHYTYFGYPDYQGHLEVSKDMPETFVGGTITGICLHQDEYECYVIQGYDNL